MNSRIYHSIIQLLVVALVGMGVARAGGVLCSAGCSHCETAAIVSCCDDMVSDFNESMPSGCDHTEICLDISDWLDMAAHSFSIDIENGAALFHATVPPPIYSVSQAPLTLLRPPPPSRSSPIYTINCSFLI